MASIRRLKKEVMYISSQFISDCIDFIDAFDGKQDAQILAAIEEVATLNNGIIERICHPDGKDNPKLVKEHYKKLKIDFIQGVDRAYSQLEKLVSEAEKEG